MSQNALTPQQLQALLSFASKKLGVSQEALARTVQSGDVQGLGLSAENRKKLESLLGDRSAVEQLIQTPQAQALLDRLTKGDGNGRQ